MAKTINEDPTCPPTIANDGPRIASTNYWDSEHAKCGLCFLSWNAGAARLLIPDNRIGVCLREMRGAREVVLSRGPWTDHGGRDALELPWEDGSDAPFSLTLVAEQADRMIPDAEQGVARRVLKGHLARPQNEAQRLL